MRSTASRVPFAEVLPPGRGESAQIRSAARSASVRSTARPRSTASTARAGSSRWTCAYPTRAGSPWASFSQISFPCLVSWVRKSVSSASSAFSPASAASAHACLPTAQTDQSDAACRAAGCAVSAPGGARQPESLDGFVEIGGIRGHGMSLHESAREVAFVARTVRVPRACVVEGPSQLPDGAPRSRGSAVWAASLIRVMPWLLSRWARSAEPRGVWRSEARCAAEARRSSPASWVSSCRCRSAVARLSRCRARCRRGVARSVQRPESTRSTRRGPRGRAGCRSARPMPHRGCRAARSVPPCRPVCRRRLHGGRRSPAGGPRVPLAGHSGPAGRCRDCSVVARTRVRDDPSGRGPVREASPPA
jgi:hypothetical protein